MSNEESRPAEDPTGDEAANNQPTIEAPETPETSVATKTPVTPETPGDVAEAELKTAGDTSGETEESETNGDGEPSSTGDMDFGAILKRFEQEQSAFQEGEVVRGTVVGVTERGVVIDFGYKSEGVVNPAEFTEDGRLTVNHGDEVEVLIKSMETQEGLPLLSRADAVRIKAWDVLEKAFDEGTVVSGRVIERIKGGLRVDIDGVAAFLPGSQVDIRPIRNLDSLRNQTVEAKIIKINRKRANVVLSRKAVVEEENQSRKGETLDHLEEGIIVDGQVKNLTDYGAFVDLGGLDGLLHITDMSWGRLAKPGQIFRVGDHLQVKILKFDREKERVSLGYKQLLPDPWESIEERYPMGMRLNGKVASVTDYGAFIELEAGVEGLVHVSEMSWSKRVKHPSKLVDVGDTVDVEVLGIDMKSRRISLGMKQTQANPWNTLAVRYQVGSRIHGKVRNLTDFGAFIEIEEGVDGLVHVSDISWSKRIKHPSEVLKKGQEIDAVIISIDTHEHRLSLSIKDLEPNSWDRFVQEHKPGSVVRGKITRFANFGAFVALADGLEGLCHISELSEEKVEKPEESFKVGQELDFKILRIESDTKKIGLSARAVNSEETPVGVRTYSTRIGAGMASLGELADFGTGGSSDNQD
ncbi:MAG: 30S ribosomal protein S1 [Pyrinomonadaceae bacterium]